MDDQKLLAAALRQLERLKRKEAFDASDLESRPNEKQLEVFRDFGKVRQQYIRAGNQCLAKGTLVATPKGPVKIENIQVGDIVYSEHGKEIKVLKTFNNGVKEVSDLTCRGVRWVSSTDNHVFQVITPSLKLEEKKVIDFGRDDKVLRVTVKSPLGSISNPTAYALGALLGDGCSRQKGKRIQISSKNNTVPNKVAQICGTSALKLHVSNYNWSVGYANIEHYADWCKDKYAHEKIADLEIVRTWDRESLLQFVAGLIDTDGSVYPAKDHVSLALGMQARSVVDAFEYACLALWQIPMSRTIDNRDKYKNGPVHIAYTRNIHFIKEILNELQPYMMSSEKHWKEEYANLGGKRSSSTFIGLQYGINKRQEETYDIHVNSETNLYLLANGLVTHNSGKSQTCARIVSWVLTDTHPFWKRPKEWGEEPLTIIVAARTGKHIEHSLLPKITGFLEPGTYKEVKVGNIVQSLELENGNTVLFQSLENANQARERLQSYVAHVVWIDELPPTMSIIRELLVRVQAKDGYFLASFTPTIVALDIQRFIDSLQKPEGHTYRFSMLDNPIYKDPERKKQLIARYAHLSDEQRQMVFEGEWLSGDNQVYYFNYDKMVRFPTGYSPLWRHVEVVDPAISSALGLTLWAENPETHEWYCILDTYVKGILVPSKIVAEVVRLTEGRNVVKRISDYAPWFTETSSEIGRKYQTVRNKNSNRKDELIKQLQESMGNKIFFSPNCDNIIKELQDCRWSDRGEGKLVNSSSYHLLDCAQYFVDNIPPAEKVIKYASQDQYLYEMNEKRKQNVYKKQLMLQKQALRKQGGRRWN